MIDNEWEIGKFKTYRDNSDYVHEQEVHINGEAYPVSLDAACLTHAILLLVDAIGEIGPDLAHGLKKNKEKEHE